MDNWGRLNNAFLENRGFRQGGKRKEKVKYDGPQIEMT